MGNGISNLKYYYGHAYGTDRDLFLPTQKSCQAPSPWQVRDMAATIYRGHVKKYATKL